MDPTVAEYDLFVVRWPGYEQTLIAAERTTLRASSEREIFENEFVACNSAVSSVVDLDRTRKVTATQTCGPPCVNTEPFNTTVHRPIYVEHGSGRTVTTENAWPTKASCSGHVSKPLQHKRGLSKNHCGVICSHLASRRKINLLMCYVGKNSIEGAAGICCSSAVYSIVFHVNLRHGDGRQKEEEERDAL